VGQIPPVASRGRASSIELNQLSSEGTSLAKKS
jgi:hypothetical protein